MKNDIGKAVFTLEQINFASEQINRIDSGEKNLFLDSVNTEQKLFGKMAHLLVCTGVKMQR